MFDFLFRKSTEAKVIHEVEAVEVVQADIAIALTMCMEEYLREATANSNLNVPDRTTLEQQYKTLVNAGLGNTKNAKLLESTLAKYSHMALNNMKAKNLFTFIKRIRQDFGEHTLLVGSKQFDEVCKKYKLTKGLLRQYTGVVPDNNIQEILNVQHKLNTGNAFTSDIGLPHGGVYSDDVYYYIKGINYGYGDSYDMLESLKKYIQSHNNLLIGSTTRGELRLSHVLRKNPGMPSIVESFDYVNLVTFDFVKLSKNELFIACPPSQLDNPDVKITRKAVDPIVFQPCAYGILIHSMWGEEAEDKVFEEYKRINNLIS